ncbi:hypothetical protein PAF17_03080 [Paracoccus sp. Z330]|uniref:DUF2937 family protein n=1 Tax=Paracoccus onchidii TaxID=3017813 RepID=A0ABT4ZAU7_9RHOB|nr:hypothetical protein [Paracoccus onchidii]MDB6176485.1 hypothetical protein [Paracoccus onchidii]
MQIARRNLMLGVSGTALAVAASGGAADAQLSEIRQRFAGLFYDLLNQLEDAIDRLTSLLNPDGVPDEDGAANEIRDVIKGLSEVQNADDMQELTRTEYTDLAEQIVARDAFTPPDPEALDTALAAGEADRSADDSWQEAIADILLESMGFEADEIDQLRNILPFADLGSEFRQLHRALAEGDWARAKRILERIVRKVFSRSVIASVVETVDGPLAQKLMRALAARAVPLLGWAWFVAAVCLAIFRNRERLLELSVGNDI